MGALAGCAAQPASAVSTARTGEALNFLRDRRPLGDTMEADELLLQARRWSPESPEGPSHRDLGGGGCIGQRSAWRDL